MTTAGVAGCGGTAGCAGDVEGALGACAWASANFVGCDDDIGGWFPASVVGFELPGCWVETPAGSVFSWVFSPAQPKIPIAKHSAKIPVRKYLMVLIPYLSSLFNFRRSMAPEMSTEHLAISDYWRAPKEVSTAPSFLHKGKQWTDSRGQASVLSLFPEPGEERARVLREPELRQAPWHPGVEFRE